MRFMILIKANEESEAGVMPSQELLEQMNKYNQAAALTRNERVRTLLLDRAAACAGGSRAPSTD
jgi:hypothetical protein